MQTSRRNTMLNAKNKAVFTLVYDADQRDYKQEYHRAHTPPARSSCVHDGNTIAAILILLAGV